MIERLLIANRGEIVCRIARTAHRMGIGTVGVYSEPDRNALHVDAVDVAVALGGAAPADSYLRGDAIIRAALDTAATAVHPGYGFLAENAEFAQAVTDAGLTWVGPTPEQIRLLGDKVAAKRAAVAAGVPTTEIIEVTAGTVPDGLAMPVLVKAAAGGGGRGMRIVHEAAQLGDAIESASREAAAAFGDGTVFIEPYIARGRHVEVQILGDQHGNVVHLGERECSIQRRNQKVIEESPSPGIGVDTRRQLHDGAIALARHVGYVGVGTVEFMVGRPGEGAIEGADTITFLEVNTRLQVEHPVTEAVTGVDLVEQQLLVADGQALSMTQDDIVVHGHAIEVRVVAEDPAADWLPSTGTLSEFHIDGDARVDTGFRAGGVVSSEYDSLLAKVIVHADQRTSAARRMARALRGARVIGVHTNVDTLAAIMVDPDFLDAATPTAYLDEHPAVLSASGPQGDDRLAQLLACVFADEQGNREGSPVLRFMPSGWRNLRTRGQRRTWLDREVEEHVEYVRHADGADVLVGPWPEPDHDGVMPPDERRSVAVRLLGRDARCHALELDGVRYVVDVVFHDADTVRTAGASGVTVWRRAPRWPDHDADLAGAGPICPLPGTVIAVHVDVGQRVTDGDILMVVEAMKMEHKITSNGDHVVRAVRFGVGDRVDTGELLVELGDIDESETS